LNVVPESTASVVAMMNRMYERYRSGHAKIGYPMVEDENVNKETENMQNGQEGSSREEEKKAKNEKTGKYDTPGMADSTQG
jgi:hypothetical protein